MFCHEKSDISTRTWVITRFSNFETFDEFPRFGDLARRKVHTQGPERCAFQFWPFPSCQNLPNCHIGLKKCRTRCAACSTLHAMAQIWRGLVTCTLVIARRWWGGDLHFNKRRIIICAMFEKNHGNRLRHLFLIPYGNWEGFDKTEMAKNGLRIFLDPWFGPSRVAKWPNLGNSSFSMFS